MASSDNDPANGATAVPRLAGVALKRLASSDNSALHNAVTRAAEEAARSGQNYAAHGSSPVMEFRNQPDQRGLGKS